MSEPLVMLVRQQKNVATYLYIIGHPALALNPDQSLTPATEQGSYGKVTQITLNATNQHYCLHFASGRELQLNQKNVLLVAKNPDDLPLSELLKNSQNLNTRLMY